MRHALAVSASLAAACIFTPATVAGAEPRLVARFDGAADNPSDRYFGHPEVTVVDSPLGKYRQAGPSPGSRFGYRFATEAGRPHLLVVRYPDDRRRNMAILDGTCYDIDAGIMTGFAHPLSGAMLEWRQVFWPRSPDSGVTVATIGRDEPAAVASIEVYQLDGLEPAAVPEIARRPDRRRFGIQFEDPCGTGASLGALRWTEWRDRLIEYMLFSGQDSLVYPIVWYHHPLYPSSREPCGVFGTVVGPDRKQYGVWTEEPPDWVGDLLEAFGRNGLSFTPSLTLLRLGSLMKGMQIDLKAIRGGAETYNNMVSNDTVQSSTGDWTPIYNVKNLQAKAEGRLAGLAYGENNVSGLSGPMFNPLHPVVRKAVLVLVGEIAGKYAKHPAFRGLSINLWHDTILWFARPEFGYDDFTVGLFETETGNKVPVDARAPDRFSLRHAYLLEHHRDAWLGWRCRKIHDLFAAMRDALRAHRQDLTLTITLWTETTVPQLLGYATGPEHQILARMSTNELYRRGGFDMALYRDMPGVEIHASPCFARDREKAASGGLGTPVEMASTFRDHDFLDRPFLGEMTAAARPGVFVFDCWIEHWGDHKWFPVEPGDPQVDRMLSFFGPKAQGVFRLNSYYPKDGFWWDSQLRIAPGFPTGLHYREHVAFALAEYDALRITRGGLFLDTGHAEEVRDFAIAFRTLPDRRFEILGGTTDPVAVRALAADGRRYLYAVNRDYYPVRLELRSAGGAPVLTDTVTGRTTEVGGAAEIEIGPYGLRVFTCAPETVVEPGKASIPPEIEGRLAREAGGFLDRVEKLRKAGALPAGVGEMAGPVRESLEKKWYARLRRQLASYPALKAAEVAAKVKQK
jgi:hypothetical protein